MRHVSLRMSRQLLFRTGQVCAELGVSRSVLFRTILNDWLRDFAHRRARKLSGHLLKK